MTNGANESREPFDLLASFGLSAEQRRQADEVTRGALAVAAEGGDVEAWLRKWAEAQTGARSHDVESPLSPSFEREGGPGLGL
jgi:hypothetical protein